MAECDEDKISLAIQNVIDNAILYTKEGSVRVAVSEDEHGIAVSVADTGIGIVADRAHMFERFYRGVEAVKMHTDGSGLGLFIVKKIIDDHGGSVMAEPLPEGGTLVTLRLRRRQQDARA
mgnify:FL=1